jgi:chromosome segregation ATPase
MAYSLEEKRNIMLYDQHDLHLPQQQKQQDVAELLEKHRQQLKAWQEQLEDFELRLAAFRQRQQELEAQLEILHGEKEYLNIRRQQWQQKQQQRRWQGYGR